MVQWLRLWASTEGGTSSIPDQPCLLGSVTKSCLTLVIPWTGACKASLSMGFSRQEWVATSFSRGFSWPSSYALQADSLVRATGASQVVLVVKNPPTNIGDIRDTGSIPGFRRSPGGGHSNPLQYSCLENPMDREAWQAIVHRVAKSHTWLKQLCMHACTHLVKTKPI